LKTGKGGAQHFWKKKWFANKPDCRGRRSASTKVFFSRKHGAEKNGQRGWGRRERRVLTGKAKRKEVRREGDRLKKSRVHCVR